MIKLGLMVLCLMIATGCSVKYEALNSDPKKQEILTNELLALDKQIDPKEAAQLAQEALSYPRVLARKYELKSPANYHNFLINAGFRERGLCYQWSEDMMEALKKYRFKSFDLRWGVAFKGEPLEHNSVVVVAKGKPFETGILIDPWRNSGELYFGKLESDNVFKWSEDIKRSHYLGTIKQASYEQ